MTRADETQAARQQNEELMAAFGQTLSTLSLEEISRLHERKEVFVREFGDLATKHAQPEPVAPPAHETIRIPCVIGGRNYLACGYLGAGEPSVDGQTMIDRTKIEGTTAIDDEEWAHLYEHRAEFERYAELKGHYLVTDRRDPDDPQSLSYFGRGGGGWYEYSLWVEDQWGGSGLVLRRCP